MCCVKAEWENHLCNLNLLHFCERFNKYTLRINHLYVLISNASHNQLTSNFEFSGMFRSYWTLIFLKELDLKEDFDC